MLKNLPNIYARYFKIHANERTPHLILNEDNIINNYLYLYQGNIINCMS